MYTDGEAPLERQALLDLQRRAHSGLPLHLATWVAICVLARPSVFTPTAMWGWTAAFTATMLVRVLLERQLPRLAETHLPRVRAAYRAVLLTNPIWWGVATATVVHTHVASGNPSGPEMLWFAFACVVACGGMSLSIDPVMRWSYPLVAVGLPSLALLPVWDETHAVAVISAILLQVFLYRTSRAMHDDYWFALRARARLADHAAELERLSTTDPLTQVANRLHFDRTCRDEWARAARVGSPVAVLLADVDFFKRVNDQHGHVFGDRCLQAVARALRDAAHRPADLVARYGGEEFVALLPDTDYAGARAVAEGMREAVAALAMVDGNERVPLAISIGVYVAEDCTAEDPGAAIGKADAAMYVAKQTGRDRVVCHPLPAPGPPKLALVEGRG